MADMMKLLKIQQELAAPKSQYNKFGNYYYRNAEDILGAVKPLLGATKTVLLLGDEIEVKGTGANERFYVFSTATLYDAETGEAIAMARSPDRECAQAKGMSDNQLTGSAISYCRKYALNGLFAIDDTKDADGYDNRQSGANPAPQRAAAKVSQPAQQKAERPAAQGDSPVQIIRARLAVAGIQPADFLRHFHQPTDLGKLAPDALQDCAAHIDDFINQYKAAFNASKATQEEIPF